MQARTEVLGAGEPYVVDSVARGTIEGPAAGNTRATAPSAGHRTPHHPPAWSRPSWAPLSPDPKGAQGQRKYLSSVGTWAQRRPLPGRGASPGPAGPQGRPPEPAELANLTHPRGQLDSPVRGSENTEGSMTHKAFISSFSFI